MLISLAAADRSGLARPAGAGQLGRRSVHAAMRTTNALTARITCRWAVLLVWLAQLLSMQQL